MLLTVTTSVVEYSYLHSTQKETGEHDFALIAASLNSTYSSSWMKSQNQPKRNIPGHGNHNWERGPYAARNRCGQPADPLDDSIHATFSIVHLKWSKDCIIQLARSTCSCELAGSSLVVALKLRNIKVGCPAHVRCNYNFLILLCSSTKIKCHCGDSDGSILQRLIKCCTRLPAELDGDFGNSNHHFVQFHQNWEMLPTWHFSWTAQDTHSKKSVLCSSPKGHNSNKVKWISLSAQKDRK